MFAKLFMSDCSSNDCGADCNHTWNIWCEKDSGDSFRLSRIFRQRIDRSAGNLVPPSLLFLV